MLRVSRQYPPEKPITVVDWQLTGSDRRSLRAAVAAKWLTEEPHSRYRYNVETCKAGNRVYLLRPTWLNKGFDFQVNVEGFRSQTREAKGQTREMPSHKDVIFDLATKAKRHPSLVPQLFAAVADVYNCSEPAIVLANRPDIASLDAAGLPPDQLLFIVKWLFIEQDLTYWLETGRDMLMSAIEREVFALV
ncbi:MAG: hypothetical protein ACE148_03400 [Vicinamibacterales bacterium]